MDAMCMHTYINIYIYIYKYICIHTYTYVYKYTRVYRYIHTYIYTSIYTCIYIYTCTNILTITYLYTYTHIDTCVYTCRPWPTIHKRSDFTRHKYLVDIRVQQLYKYTQSAYIFRLWLCRYLHLCMYIYFHIHT